MDRHMDNKHPDRLNLDRETDAEADADAGAGAGAGAYSGRCLGDLCPVLGCGEYDIGDCRVEIISGGGGDEGTVRRGCGVCDPADMERRRHDCVALFGRYVRRKDRGVELLLWIGAGCRSRCLSLCSSQRHCCLLRRRGCQSLPSILVVQPEGQAETHRRHVVRF